MSATWTQHRSPRAAIEVALRLAEEAIYDPRRNPPSEAVQRIAVVLDNTIHGTGNRRAALPQD